MALVPPVDTTDGSMPPVVLVLLAAIATLVADGQRLEEVTDGSMPPVTATTATDGSMPPVALMSEAYDP